MKVASQEPDFKFGETNKSEAFLKKFPLGKVGEKIVGVHKVSKKCMTWLAVKPVKVTKSDSLPKAERETCMS